VGVIRQPGSRRSQDRGRPKRQAEIDGRRIRAEVSDLTAKLHGHVDSLNEASAGWTPTASAPGVATAESHLVVSPWRRPTVLRAAAGTDGWPDGGRGRPRAEGKAMGPALLVCPDGSGAVVRIEGEIDVCVADQLQELLLRIMRAHGPRLLLDLSAVSFMDCAGLRALALTARRAELCGWSMHLIATSAIIQKIITLTGTEDALPVRDECWNSGSGPSSQPKAKECYRIDSSSV
jgi:anti-anti-sigma factor